MRINGADIPVIADAECKEFNAKDVQHETGYATEQGWAVKNDANFSNRQRGNGGYLVKGAFLDYQGTAGIRTIFKMKIDNNDYGVWDEVMRIELFDCLNNTVISEQTIERNYFRASDSYQNFVLYGSLLKEGLNKVEARIWYYGKAAVEVEKISMVIDTPKAGMPTIVNKSSASDKHITKLVKKAIKGLGFNNTEGPNANDLIFVNNYYMAWVDQTGYYGKMNGAWLLNNGEGKALNFEEKTIIDGRVVNYLVVAEEGNGQWPGSYMGAEHFEIPSYIKENDDDKTPVEKGISNWYTINEANLNLGTGGSGHIPWWTCCSGQQNNKPSFDQMNPPITYEAKENSLTVNYLAPVTKGVDADGNYNGDRCQANLLFYNNIRYPVFLKLGYVFYDDKPYWDRTYQMINPEGNKTLRVNTFWAVIHGVLITKTPNSIAWKKELFASIQPNNDGMYVKGIKAPEKEWSDLDIDTETDLIGGLGALNSAFTISENKSFDTGASFYYGIHNSFRKPIEAGHIGNISFCKCVVHGNWEIGGGMLDNSYPIKPGEGSRLVTRRFGFPQGEPFQFNEVK